MLQFFMTLALCASSVFGTAAESLPPGWSQAIDPNTGKVYYKNHNTQTTQWEKPKQIFANTAPPQDQQRRWLKEMAEAWGGAGLAATLNRLTPATEAPKVKLLSENQVIKLVKALTPPEGSPYWPSSSLWSPGTPFDNQVHTMLVKWASQTEHTIQKRFADMKRAKRERHFTPEPIMRQLEKLPGDSEVSRREIFDTYHDLLDEEVGPKPTTGSKGMKAWRKNFSMFEARFGGSRWEDLSSLREDNLRFKAGLPADLSMVKSVKC